MVFFLPSGYDCFAPMGGEHSDDTNGKIKSGINKQILHPFPHCQTKAQRESSGSGRGHPEKMSNVGAGHYTQTQHRKRVYGKKQNKTQRHSCHGTTELQRENGKEEHDRQNDGNGDRYLTPERHTTTPFKLCFGYYTTRSNEIPSDFEKSMVI